MHVLGIESIKPERCGTTDFSAAINLEGHFAEIHFALVLVC